MTPAKLDYVRAELRRMLAAAANMPESAARRTLEQCAQSVVLSVWNAVAPYDMTPGEWLRSPDAPGADDGE